MIAYHEAGHALLARLMREDIHKVTIVPAAGRSAS